MEHALAIIRAFGKSNYGEVKVMLRLDLKHAGIRRARNDALMTAFIDPRIILLKHGRRVFTNNSFDGMDKLSAAKYLRKLRD